MFFFIGGAGADSKPFGRTKNLICPSCGRYCHLEVFKSYRYFHAFFIRIFKWNVEYFGVSSCCGTVYNLKKELIDGQDRENIDVSVSELNVLKQGATICHACGRHLNEVTAFCPHCGEKQQEMGN